MSIFTKADIEIETFHELKIVRDMLHEQLTLHHNLEIHQGSYMELLGGAGDLVQSPTIANALDNLAMQKAKAINQQIDSLSRPI